MRLRQLLKRPLTFALLLSVLLAATSVLALQVHTESTGTITVEPGVTFSDVPYTYLNITLNSTMTFSSISLTPDGISFDNVGLNITKTPNTYPAVNISLIKWSTAQLTTSLAFPFIFNVTVPTNTTLTLRVFGLNRAYSYNLFKDNVLQYHYPNAASLSFSASPSGTHLYSIQTDLQPGEAAAATIRAFVVFVLFLLPILVSFMAVRGVLAKTDSAFHSPFRRDKD